MKNLLMAFACAFGLVAFVIALGYYAAFFVEKLG